MAITAYLGGRDKPRLHVKGLRSAFAGAPIEILVGLIVIAAGFAVGAWTSSDGLQALGSVLVGVGGVLASFAATNVFARDDALKDVRAHVDVLSRQLATAASQISTSLAQSQEGSLAPSTCMAMISQTNRSLYGLVNELQVLIGKDFDSAQMISTAATVARIEHQFSAIERELALSIDDEDDEGVGDVGDVGDSQRRAETAELSENLTAIRVELSALGDALNTVGAGRTSEIADIKCPACQADSTVTLRATSAGDLRAYSKCPTCRTRLVTRQGPDAALRTQIHGVGKVCPNCRSSTLKTPFDVPGREMRVCVTCSRLLVAGEAPGGWRIVDAEPVTRDPVARQAGTAAIVVTCPECQRPTCLNLKGAAGWLGACPEDRLPLCTPETTASLPEIPVSELRAGRSASQQFAT